MLPESHISLSHTRGEESIISSEQCGELFDRLCSRLSDDPVHYIRPEEIKFQEIERAFEKNPEFLQYLLYMESTGGEPDIIGANNDFLIFTDFALEVPKARCNISYEQAFQSALSAGGRIINKWNYYKLHRSGEFDLRSRSWIFTGKRQKNTGYAFCCGRDKGDVKTYEHDISDPNHNLGWRMILEVPRRQISPATKFIYRVRRGLGEWLD